ncbi:MAG: DUF481 domain-containing protein [Spirulina sp.]
MTSPNIQYLFISALLLLGFNFEAENAIAIEVELSPDIFLDDPNNRSDVENVPQTMPNVLPPAPFVTSKPEDSDLLQALEVANALDDPLGQATLLSDIAQQYAELGQANIAADILSRAFEVAKTIEDAPAKNRITDAIVRQYLEIGQPSSALAIVASLDNAPVKIPLMGALAQYYTQLGQPSRAADILSDSLTLADTVDDASLKARLLATIALEYNRLGQPESVDRLLSQSQTILARVARGFPFQSQPLSGNFGYNFSASFFDTSTAVASFDLQLQQQWEIDDIHLVSNFSLDFDNDRSVNQLRPGGLMFANYRHHFSRKWHYFTDLTAQLNQGFFSASTEDEDTVFTGGIVMGGGVNLWRGKSPQQFLDLQMGVGVRYDFDDIVSEDVFVSRTDPVLWMALWSRNLPLGATEIDQILAFSPSLTNANNFEVLSRTKFSIPLTENLSFVNTLQLRYRNEPILESNPNWNILFSTGFGYDF